MSTAEVPETWDCAPSLTDGQVLEFCKNGYLMLEGVVPDEINRRSMEYCATDHPNEMQGHHEPTGILQEEWFRSGVTLNPTAAAAVRSLLGPHFHLPILMSNHRQEAPFPQLGWHVDGNSQYSCALNNLQVFYLPQDTPLEMGPTQVLPGSHLVHNKAHFMAHLDAIRGAVPTVAPAGSIFLTVYQIWHRRGRATGHGWRNLLKYFYWRTQPPRRDWVMEDDFRFSTACYSSPMAGQLEQFRDDIKVAEMFMWLCGQHDKFQNRGGQSWPLPGNRNGLPYGLPEGLG